MKLRLSGPLLLLVPVLLGAVAAAAQSMYRWVDENGRVTYSDQPPVGKVKAQEKVQIVAPLNSGAAKEVAKQETQFKKRQDEAAKKVADANKKEQFEAIRLESCNRARGELRALRENIPIARMTESGERVTLDGSAREVEGMRLENFLEESCRQPSG